MMAHLRKRILEESLKKSIGWSPVTSVYGQRQTGKTTLLKQLACSFETFDDLGLAESILRQKENFFKNKKTPLLLDEVQKFPPVFHLIKKQVDQHKRPGQFLLTGSVRFSQKKDIRESLTGRTTLWELLPLTTSERLEKKFIQLWNLISHKSADQFKSKAHLSESIVLKNHHQGGLPGICFIRNEEQRNQALQNHLGTLIERDLPLIRQTKIASSKLFEFLRLLVPLQGQEVNLSELARKMRISSPAVKQLLFAFEGLFLIRKVGKTYFFEDAGIAAYLDPNPFCDKYLLILHWVYTELRAQWIYRQDQVLSFDSYRTRGGASLPFTIRLRNGERLGFTIEPSDEITEKAVKSIYSFQRVNKNARGIILYTGKHLQVLNRNIWVVPFHWIA